MILAKNIKDNIYNVSLFRIFYTISLLFEIIAFTPLEIFAGWINGVSFVWGITICFHWMFHDPEKFNVNYKVISSIFIFLCFFTSCINFSSDILLNLISSFNNFIYLVLFFGINKNTSHEDIEKEFNFLSRFIIFFSLIASLLSIYVSFKLKHVNFLGHDLGIFRNRFFGISTNPNQLGFISVISIFLCDLLSDKYTIKRVNPIFSIICVLLNIIILFLTDSNASFVLMTVYLIIRISYESIAKYDEFKNVKLIREMISTAICMSVVVSGSFLARSASQKFMDSIINFKDSNISFNNREEISESSTQTESPHLGRGNHELSSGRILLFKQGLRLSKIHPLIGIGRENLYYYSKMYIKNGLAFPCKHPDLHNLYLTILVSYGIIGLFLFLILIFLSLYRISCKLFTNVHTKKSRYISKLFSVIIAYLSYVNFEVGGLSGISISDVMFWVFLGYCYHISGCGKAQKKQL